MKNEEKEMEYRIPDYYTEFSCTADACEDTCCAGWQIVIDPESLKKYKRVVSGKKGVSGKMRCKVSGGVNWLRGTFRQDKEKRCAFLNESNLCDMYTGLGKNSLCRTCRLYPRHIEEFEGVREITLSVSCPEAARILMEKTEPVRFLTCEKEGEEEYEDFDPFLYSMLADAREAMIGIMQKRTLDIRVRVKLVLGMAHDIQGRVNRQEIFSCMDVIERYQTERAAVYTAGTVKQAEEKKDFLRRHELFRNLYELELLREDWDMLLMETEEILYAEGEAHYRTLAGKFAEWQKEHMPELQIHLEQIMVYFLSTYFCGAVYDARIYAKAQMAAVSVLLIREFWMARWKKNGEALEKEEMTEILYRYSRELEHSDQNLACMERQMEERMLLGK